MMTALSEKSMKESDKQAMDQLEQNVGSEHSFSIYEPLLPTFTKDQAQETYYIAYRLYHKKCYQEAGHFFRFLTLLDPMESKYWKGLGACLQMCKAYEEALSCYVCVQTLQADQPDPYVYAHTADCYFALNQVAQGLQALKGAEKAAQQQKNDQVLSHVDLMAKLWNNR